MLFFGESLGKSFLMQIAVIHTKEGRHSPGTCGEQENFLATVVEAEDIAADGGTASDYGIYL